MGRRRSRKRVAVSVDRNKNIKAKCQGDKRERRWISWQFAI
jgi:hypothetical protein